MVCTCSDPSWFIILIASQAKLMAGLWTLTLPLLSKLFATTLVGRTRFTDRFKRYVHKTSSVVERYSHVYLDY
jgi:hypothetical protein